MKKWLHVGRHIYLLGKKKNPVYIKWQGWQPTHKKYQANKSTRTQKAKKKHNNQDIMNTLIK